jgi:hypothetical protein
MSPVNGSDVGGRVARGLASRLGRGVVTGELERAYIHPLIPETARFQKVDEIT